MDSVVAKTNSSTGCDMQRTGVIVFMRACAQAWGWDGSDEAMNDLHVLAEFLALLHRILEVRGSNLGPEAGYPDWRFRNIPQSLETNAGIVL
jgi:hypothetical protein